MYNTAGKAVSRPAGRKLLARNVISARHSGRLPDHALVRSARASQIWVVIGTLAVSEALTRFLATGREKGARVSSYSIATQACVRGSADESHG